MIAQEISLVPTAQRRRERLPRDRDRSCRPRRSPVLATPLRRARRDRRSSASRRGCPWGHSGSRSSRRSRSCGRSRATAKLIVMDEPTAALTGDEAQKLLEIVRDLRDRERRSSTSPTSSRRCSRSRTTVTVLRDGRLVETAAAAGKTAASLVTAMLGRTMETTFPPKITASSRRPCRALRREPRRRRGFLRDISLDVRAGEIVGLAGLVGSGRTEVARAIFGADPTTRRHDLRRWRGGTDRLAAESGASWGSRSLPESRKSQGLLMGRSIAENVTPAPPRARLAARDVSCGASNGRTRTT